jgi:hypothetical protein
MKGPDDHLKGGFTAWKSVKVTGNKRQSTRNGKGKFSHEMTIVFYPKFKKKMLWKQ